MRILNSFTPHLCIAIVALILVGALIFCLSSSVGQESALAEVSQLVVGQSYQFVVQGSGVPNGTLSDGSYSCAGNASVVYNGVTYSWNFTSIRVWSSSMVGIVGTIKINNSLLANNWCLMVSNESMYGWRTVTIYNLSSQNTYPITDNSFTFSTLPSLPSNALSFFMSQTNALLGFNNHLVGWSSFEANADIDYPSSSASLNAGFYKHVALKGQYLSDFVFYTSYNGGYVNGVFYPAGFNMVSNVSVFDPDALTFTSYDGILYFDFVLPYGEDPVIENGVDVSNYRTLFIFISEPFTLTVEGVSSLSSVCAYAFGSTSDPLTPGGGSFRQEDIIVYQPDQTSFFGSYSVDQKKLWNYVWGQFSFYRTPMMVGPVTSSSPSVVTYYGFDYPLYSTYFEVSSDFPYPNGNVFHIDMQMRDIVGGGDWTDVLDPTFNNPYYFIPTTGTGLDNHLPVSSDSVFEYRYRFDTLYTGDNLSVGSSWYSISSDVSSLNEGLSYEIFVNGFNTGARTSYQRGYEDGVVVGSSVPGTLVNMVFSTIEIPFKILLGEWDENQHKYVNGLVTFNIFGVDLRDFLLSLIAILFFVRVWTIFASGSLPNLFNGGGGYDSHSATKQEYHYNEKGKVDSVTTTTDYSKK